MARELCIRCYELLPETESGEGQCPHCELEFSAEPSPGGVLRALPGQGGPLTGEALAKWKQQQANDAAHYASGAKFPLLGLDDSWEGIRWVGGYKGSSPQLERVELMHGRREDPLQASVDTRLKTDGIFSVRTSLENLMWSLWREYEDGLEYLQAAIRDDSPIGLWEPTTINVNGVQTTAHHVLVGSSDVVVVETDELVITVDSRGLPREDVKLVDADLRRYRDVFD